MSHSPNPSGDEHNAENALWPHVFIPGLQAEPVLLMLHGTGGTEHDLLPLAAKFAPKAAILAPRGRVNENGLNRWFRRFGEGAFDVEDVLVRAGELASFLDWAKNEYFLQGRRTMAVGFSNGANIALAMAMHTTSVQQVVAFSGMYPFDGRAIRTNLSSLEVALYNGTDDPAAPAESVNKLVDVLQSNGATVSLHLREGGHGLYPQDIDGARSWVEEHRLRRA